MFGVASLFSSLAGEPPGQEEKGDGTHGPPSPQDKTPPEAGSSAAAGVSSALGALNIWGLANAVRAQADELVKSVAQTDWKAEIMAFSKEAAEEGSKISHKALEVVEHIPDVVEHILPAEHGDEKDNTSASRSQPEGFLPPDVGTTIRTFGTSLFRGTKDLIEQVRDAVESEIAIAAKEAKQKSRTGINSSRGMSGSNSGAQLNALSGAGAKYSRFEAEVAAMQRDSSTYCDEPADRDEYDKWKTTFSVQGAQAQIDAILADNSFMAELYARIVPVIVEHEDFWTRYFYRLQKLQAKEEARQALAQRAKAVHQEEDEIAWEDLDTPTATSQPVRDTPAATVVESHPETESKDGTVLHAAEAAAGSDSTMDKGDAARQIVNDNPGNTLAVAAAAQSTDEAAAGRDLIIDVTQPPAPTVPTAHQQEQEHVAGPLEEASDAMASATSSPTGRFSQDAHETGSEANSQGTSWVALDATSSRGTASGHASDAGAPATPQLQPAQRTAPTHAPTTQELQPAVEGSSHQLGSQGVESRASGSAGQLAAPVLVSGSPAAAASQTSKQSEGQPAAPTAAALIVEAAAAGQAAQQGVTMPRSEEDLLDEDLDLDSPPDLPAGVKANTSARREGAASDEEEEDEAWGDWD